MREVNNAILEVYRGIRVKIITGSPDHPFTYRGEIIKEDAHFIFINDPVSKLPISIGKKDILKIQEDVR